MKRLIRAVVFSLVRPVLTVYLSKKRYYRFGKTRIEIWPGVFHPGFFFSTQFLLRYLLQFDLKGKTLLELGAGSGLISFVAENHGAVVTATDMSENAISGLQHNKAKLKSSITIVRSDLFDGIPLHSFHFIVINPPYYPKNPSDEKDLAWYCGQNFEYFEKLFRQLPSYLFSGTNVIIVLSDVCNMQRITEIAGLHHLSMIEKSRKKFWWEWNYVFEITLSREK